MKKNWHHSSFHYWPILFAFLLPFGGVVLSWVIALWALHSFTLIKSNFHPTAWRKPAFLLPVLFFVATVSSALSSANATEGHTAIEVKLSFLLLPYLLFLFHYRFGTFYKTIGWYLAGLVVSLLFLLANGVITYLKSGTFPYYMSFSAFLHPSYFSMYLSLGIVFLIVLPHQTLMPLLQNKWVFLTVLIFLCIGVILAASKIGMVILALVLPLAGIYKFRSYFSLKKSLLLILGFIVLGFLFTRLFPESLNRLSSIQHIHYQQLNKASTESTEVRLLIWQQCLDLLPKAGFLGFGVGDINDVLYQKYFENNLSGAYEHRLNAHNQYFQTLLGMGYLGFLILLTLTLGLSIWGLLKQNVLIGLAGLIFTLNFCVESMLQTSAGNLGFVFILVLLTAFYDKKEKRYSV